MSGATPAEPTLTVVVCTYNRRQLALQALETLIAQEADPTRFEILAVDNGSTDGTREAVTELVARHPHVRYTQEHAQGLSHARNRGWREARGRYVAYVDDDCRMPPAYVSVALEIIDRMAPAGIGGPVLPFYGGSKPAWYRDYYCHYVPGDRARPFETHEFAFGGNMVLRRSVLEALGGFQPEFGMAGDVIGYGEEIVPQQMLRRRMPDEIIYYDPRMYVRHLVRSEKTSLWWCLKERVARGRDGERIFHSAEPVSPRPVLRRQILRSGIELAKDVARAFLRRDRTKYPHVQNYLFEKSFDHVHRLGRLFERYRRAGEA